MRILDDQLQTELLIRLKQGDEGAFNLIYKAYSKPIYLRILRLVKDSAIADELLQDMFLKVWTGREKIDPEKSFKAYLYTIAHHLVYNYFRKVASNQTLTEHLIHQAINHDTDDASAFELKESVQILKQAVQQLSPQRRQVFQLCKFDGKSYHEVSTELGISVATVNSHMTQSVRLVKEYMVKNYHLTGVLLFVGACHATTLLPLVCKLGNLLNGNNIYSSA